VLPRGRPSELAERCGHPGPCGAGLCPGPAGPRGTCPSGEGPSARPHGTVGVTVPEGPRVPGRNRRRCLSARCGSRTHEGRAPPRPHGRARVPGLHGMGQVYHGWALAMLGRTDEGITELRQGLAGYVAIGQRAALGWYLGFLAEAQLLAGQMTD